jgi:hypothetical protein
MVDHLSGLFVGHVLSDHLCHRLAHPKRQNIAQHRRRKRSFEFQRVRDPTDTLPEKEAIADFV